MGVAWFTYPLSAHMFREEPACELTPEQCAYKADPWRNWYVADYVYARGTVYFFVLLLGLCAAGWWALRLAPARLRARPAWRKAVAAGRYAAYRRVRVRVRGTTTTPPTTPPLGVLLLLGAGALFLALMALAPRPYYWPADGAGGAASVFGDSPPLATRAGWLALAAVPFVVLFAAKASAVGALTGVGHERLMVFHACSAWAVLVLALLHTAPFVVYNQSVGASQEMWDTMWYYWTGLVALVAQAYLTLMSVPWLRNACYEFFKATHYLMAAVFMVFLFIHCGFTLSSADYFIVAGVLYFGPWSYAQMKTYFDHGIRRAATITPLPASPRTVRLDVPVGALTLWAPGQHVFLRVRGLGAAHALTAHPFSLCSLPAVPPRAGAPLPPSVMTFYVTARGGFTRRLVAAAAGRGSRAAAAVPVLLEGAYGGVGARPLAGYDRALVVACGSGVGFSLPFVMEWIAAAAAQQQQQQEQQGEGPREEEKAAGGGKMTVVLATRDAGTVQWYAAALREFLQTRRLAMPAAGVVDVAVHLTGAGGGDAPAAAGGGGDDADADTEAAAAGDARVPGGGRKRGASSTVPDGGLGEAPALGIRVLRGRPDLAAAVREVTMEDHASVGIAVCGPGSVLQTVREEAAAAEWRILRSGPGAREVYLYSEQFGW